MTAFQQEVIELISKNYSVSEISKILNRSQSSISSIIKRFNIVDYKKLNVNTCNNTYFDKIDNEFKAYYLGFFIADGYLHTKSNRFGVSIQEQDNIILEYMKKDICPDSIITTKNRTTEAITRKNQSTLRWSSEHMKNIFQNVYNINPNKTYDFDFEFPFEKIPENLIRHFIRGFIDGDGCFAKIKYSISITLIGTSNTFLKQIAKYITGITDGVNEIIREINGKTINYYTLNFNFERTNKPDKILKIYNYLYNDSELFLIRKRNKMEEYLKYRGKL